MTVKDVLRNSIQLSDMILSAYLTDLSDSDILIRAVPGMNHIAWQLGHLISSERRFVELVRPGTSPALPEGFEAAHAKESATDDNPEHFHSLANYQKLWKAQREASLSAVEAIGESEYDRADPSFPPYAPTVGAILGMIGSHTLMHAGQFVAVRRLLGKPVTI